MHNISRKTNRKFILKNCLLLSTVYIGLLISGNANATKDYGTYNKDGYPLAIIMNMVLILLLVITLITGILLIYNIMVLILKPEQMT